MKYLNALTSLGIIIAAISCYLVFKNQFLWAFLLVICAMIIDALDGPLARKYKLDSRTGRILDSVGDILIYLLFPAIYWYSHLPIIIIAIMVLVGVGRLIFTQTGKVYRGLPVYYLQFLLFLTLILTVPVWLVSILILIASVLMISFRLNVYKIPAIYLLLLLIPYLITVFIKF